MFVDKYDLIKLEDISIGDYITNVNENIFLVTEFNQCKVIKINTDTGYFNNGEIIEITSRPDEYIDWLRLLTEEEIDLLKLELL